MTIRTLARVLTGLAALASPLVAQEAAAQSARGLEARSAAVIEHWTPARRLAAIPRDLVIDARGIGYLRLPGNILIPHGHDIVAMKPPTGGGGTATGGKVRNSEWTNDGVVQNAAGRIYFYMPDSPSRQVWVGYVCSGTAVADGATGRSVILTAAHCVYDDANKAFARDVLFIPDQADTTAGGTNRNCADDPYGCWVPNFGAVDTNWANRVFPNNVKWDYAFYVVNDNDAGAHGAGFLSNINPVLDIAVTPMDVSFTAPSLTLTHALGYSYDRDPKFMYCAEKLANLNPDNWWVAGCGLSGGSSGGPWVNPMNMTAGNGPIISVNSWGYANQPGMAGPKLSGTSASCVFATAKSASFGTFASGNAGYIYSGSCP